jgi:Mn2+/Fe2+ NRAMP family transporter
MAARTAHALVAGGERVNRGPPRVEVAPRHRLPRTRLSCRRRLHGTRQLGDIVPAAAVTIAYEEGGTLILSQVVLSLQLPFAVIPLVTMRASRNKMGELVAPLWLSALAFLIAAVIVTLNMKLLVDFVIG